MSYFFLFQSVIKDRFIKMLQLGHQNFTNTKQTRVSKIFFSTIYKFFFFILLVSLCRVTKSKIVHFKNWQVKVSQKCCNFIYQMDENRNFRKAIRKFKILTLRFSNPSIQKTRAASSCVLFRNTFTNSSHDFNEHILWPSSVVVSFLEYALNCAAQNSRRWKNEKKVFNF